MAFVQSSVLKKNPEDGADGAADGLCFCTVQEGFSAFLRRTAGKILAVSDANAFSALAFAARDPRTVSVVTEDDALPLFAMPETGGVFAVGGEGVLRAARLYAQVRKIPCVLFPSKCELDGVFELQGEVPLHGGRIVYPLSAAKVCVDESLVAPSLAEGYARLLLCRLALFEQSALARFFGEKELSENREKAFAVVSGLGEEPKNRDILLKNAALRRLGTSEGEGKVLARSAGNFAAFESLTALYVAFFRCGEPLKTVVPDYAARAREAGIPYARQVIPTEETFARRALVFGGRRAEFLRELRLITQNSHIYRRNYRMLGGTVTKALRADVKYLPERAGGLSAVIRDFGLMEKL